jgi:UDP-2-acetamido-3-amino-2,3-dideoxy-glucuronate N-acetyltransferase
MNFTINDIKEIDLPNFQEENGLLIVADGIKDIPFTISRFFMVKGLQDSVRGQHAHRNCKQFLLCINGTIEILCDDGNNKNEFKLECPNRGLFVPPGIWAEQEYIESDSILVALCDQPFDESDYIRNYEEFLSYRKGLSK